MNLQMILQMSLRKIGHNWRLTEHHEVGSVPNLPPVLLQNEGPCLCNRGVSHQSLICSRGRVHGEGADVPFPSLAG